MQELDNSLRKEIDVYGIENGDHHLRNCAIKWSEHALKNYSENLLRKAMSISVAICEFVNGLEKND